MNIQFIKYSKIYYIFSGILVVGAIFSLFVFGLNFGIDFKGGSILEAEFEKRPNNQEIIKKLVDLKLGELIVQPTEKEGVILRFKAVDENTHQKIISRLNELSKVKEKRFESIGPAIGKEIRSQSLVLIIISLILMLIYITIAFRRVSRPISSFQYGLTSIVVLFFDILIPLGLFAILGKFYNAQFTIPIIAALLTILGYTINDKIVVFDRIRENLLRARGEEFDEIVNRSLNEILVRSINTSLSTMFVLLAIFFFGGKTLKYFSLTLTVGILAGTYSSIFLASPILVSWLKLKRKRV